MPCQCCRRNASKFPWEQLKNMEDRTIDVPNSKEGLVSLSITLIENSAPCLAPGKDQN
jgi:hypothetical protein